MRKKIKIAFYLLMLVLLQKPCFADVGFGGFTPASAAEETIAHQMQTDCNAARTHVNHNSVYVRTEAVKLLVACGTAGDIPLIQTQVQAETDSEAYFYLNQLLMDFEYRTTADKANYVTQKLSQMNSSATPPLDEFVFLMKKAEELNLQNVISDIQSIPGKLEEFDVAERVSDTVDFLSISDTRSALNSSNSVMRGKAIQRITDHSSADHEDLSNEFLLTFFNQKKGQEFNYLKSRMEEKGMLRTENANASFESGSTLPTGWSMVTTTITNSAGLSTTSPYSFQKSLRFNIQTGQTVIRTAYFPLQNFMAGRGAEKGLEFGFSYRRVFENGTVSDGTDFTVKLKLEVSQPGGINSQKEIILTQPAETNWNKATDYLALTGDSIGQVRLTLFAQGKGEVYIDDVYVRRPDTALENLPPVVSYMTASSENVQLNAQGTASVQITADATDPEGGAVTGKWYETEAGDLGDGFQKTIQFSTAGQHTVFFTPFDDFGIAGETEQIAIQVN